MQGHPQLNKAGDARRSWKAASLWLRTSSLLPPCIHLLRESSSVCPDSPRPPRLSIPPTLHLAPKASAPQRRKRVYVSTSASPLHRQAASGHPGQAEFAWKEELNARLREHRQRREDGRSTGASAPVARPNFSEEDTPAGRVAARVAARYRDAPSYTELLAASAEAAAVAAETAAVAAHEAHVAAQVAAQAALQSWQEQQVEPDVFSDPFFTTPRHTAYEAARPRWGETALPPEMAPDPCPAQCDAPPPVFQGPVTVAHHAPLPERVPVPERQPVVARARALVDAFAEALVPAAQQLPAKLIEFPRELIAAHRQRPRLAEGPLLEPEQPGTSLRIFEVEEVQGAREMERLEVGQQAAEVPQEVHHTVNIDFDDPAAYSPVGASAVEAMLDFDGEMGKQTVDDSFEEAPRRRGGFLFEEGAQDRPRESAPSPQAPSTPRPVTEAERRAKATPMERASSREDVAPLWKSKAQQPSETGWSSIRLGEHPRAETATTQATAPAAVSAEEPRRVTAKAARVAETAYPAVQTATETAFESIAPISDRCMGALVDFGIVFGSFLVGMLVFASCTEHPPAGKAALAVAALVLGGMGAFYGWLFMSYGGGSTPGMRYARIALCTFEDANPSRKELQNRIPATALALLPLGLGLIWALFDEDRLGWHDRMTRTYQRSYR